MSRPHYSLSECQSNAPLDKPHHVLRGLADSEFFSARERQILEIARGAILRLGIFSVDSSSGASIKPTSRAMALDWLHALMESSQLSEMEKSHVQVAIGKLRSLDITLVYEQAAHFGISLEDRPEISVPDLIRFVKSL